MAAKMSPGTPLGATKNETKNEAKNHRKKGHAGVRKPCKPCSKSKQGGGVPP